MRPLFKKFLTGGGADIGNYHDQWVMTNRRCRVTVVLATARPIKAFLERFLHLKPRYVNGTTSFADYRILQSTSQHKDIRQLGN